ncbi:MAG: PAS domain S-box protein [Candidatus Harrisonbacteria bacterium]|nr:PAS domain S-box protein [Candidatus Harrisonbacteria bacterium]
MAFFDFLKPKPTSGVSEGAEITSLSDAWLRSIVSELSDAIVAYDEHFKVLIFNKAAERVFGVAAEMALGTVITIERASETALKRLVQVVFPSLAPTVIPRSEPGVYPQVTDIQFEDTLLRVITNRITDAEGKTQGFVKVIRDRTREAEILKSKSEFITVAAHQLRTPLTAVTWAFGGLKKDAALGADSKMLVDTGDLAAQKLLNIVNDLLDVAKMEGGKYGYEFRSGDFIAFLDGVLQSAKPVAASYNVELFFEAPNEPLPMDFDQQKLATAVMNLLENAIKYNVPNGTVTVALRKLPNEPYALVTVKDTGVGIPTGDLKKLFTKFFRAENVTKFSTEGSGLGLYLVKNIINRHGGKIWAESELGRGTTFSFTLPTDPALIPKKEVIEEE